MYSVEDIKAITIPIFKEYNVRSAVLFGSYAKNTAVSSSDIDICVDSGLKGLRFFGLLEDVCTAVDRPVDLIDISEIDVNSRIYNEIQNTGVMIYETNRN